MQNSFYIKYRCVITLRLEDKKKSILIKYIKCKKRPRKKTAIR